MRKTGTMNIVAGPMTESLAKRRVNTVGRSLDKLPR
jgi:hypothetical protein